MKANAVMFDIDGTLADTRRRAHLLPYECSLAWQDWKHELWTKYNDDCINDPVIESNVELLRLFAANEFFIFISTNRPINVHAQTISWLNRNNIPVNGIQMRMCSSSPAVLKMGHARWLMERFKVSFAFDDDIDVVKAWRTLDIAAFLVMKANSPLII